jgi:hypothetical protein
MRSLSSNKEVANQFIITTDEGEYFQSYDSVIAFKPSGYRGQKIPVYLIHLDETYWDYSTTTGKYRNAFLGETIEETREKIKSGEYVLTNLN